MPPYDADIIIVGAGLSGMSLAMVLAARGYAGRVMILDKRADFDRDQRWCTWGPVDSRIAPLATHSWPRWQVIGEKESYKFHLPERPYVEFQAARYFSVIADELSRLANVDLCLGREIRAIRNKSRWAEVETSDGTLRAKWVIDARGEGALPAERRAGDVWLWQSFVGLTVTTSVATFEPGCATLMDFRTPQAAAAEFFYMLPYSSTCALVECTVVDAQIWALDTYRDHVEGYLARLGLDRGQWTSESEEIGSIPMTTRAFAARAEGAVIPLGLGAGAAKPSTGYGFARAQKQVDVVAGALLAGSPLRLQQPSARAAALDTILLDVVASYPDQFRRGMLRLFERTDAATIVRFLTEESSALDDLRVASVVGSAKFAEAAIARYAGPRR